MPVSLERELVVEGSARVLDITVSPVLDENGTLVGTTGISRDITDRKRTEAERRHAEEQMQHAQKLESLGVLAGGIAHDFNNLLGGILGNAELARRELPPDSPTRALCDEIAHSALRAAELTRQMLAYSGKGQLESRPLDLSHTVETMAELLRANSSPKAILRLELAADLPLVEADVTQVRQMVANLVANASEALVDGVGTITVRTERIEIAARQLADLDAQGELAAGVFAVVAVSDTGQGMDADTKTRMFEPFFTTKFVGRGLGLAAVLGIVRGHHGAILTHTEAGRGTTFRILFPAIAVPAAPIAQPPSANGTREREQGRELILVVDDEPAVRKMVARMLEFSSPASPCSRPRTASTASLSLKNMGPPSRSSSSTC